MAKFGSCANKSQTNQLFRIIAIMSTLLTRHYPVRSYKHLPKGKQPLASTFGYPVKTPKAVGSSTHTITQKLKELIKEIRCMLLPPKLFHLRGHLKYGDENRPY
ncbi:hypothetical protein AVEN_201211-1 [Araneus ventricosus]|uniref:Uncharacterized protein n=1 Tax=Araneus ventricosus TaxID=182803 RepID=A0A4Y2HPS1_ARAVE|nr:hypothetical protein AVEN_201211-1 [Araneus ventricosus]